MNNRKSNNNKKKAFSIIILLLLILISVVAVAFKFFGNSKSGIEIDGNAKDYVSEAKVPEDYDESKILIPGFGNINVEKNYKEKGMQLFNPEKNDVYFKYELTLKETNEIICTTNLIPPGKSVEVFPWENIPEGSYTLIANIRTYSIENPETELNGANVEIKMDIY